MMRILIVSIPRKSLFCQFRFDGYHIIIDQEELFMAYQFGYPETKPVGTGGTGTLFAGKRCFITGASSGIGFGLAQRLLERGAEVWISSRNEGRIRAAFEKLSSFGPVHFAALDVCDGDAIERYLNEMAASGPIDYVFANAGVSTAHAFEKTTRQAFDRIMEPNFYGVFYTDQAAIPHLLRQGHGYILNVSSMEGYFANGYHSAYIASKFAVFGLTESLRYEYASFPKGNPTPPSTQAENGHQP